MSVGSAFSTQVCFRAAARPVDVTTDLLRVMPWTGAFFAVGILALIGLPRSVIQPVIFRQRPVIDATSSGKPLILPRRVQ